MGRTIIISRTLLYRIALGLCDYFHNENPVCSITKPRAPVDVLTLIVTSCIDFKYIKTNITADALQYLYSSPSWLYLVNCAV